MYVDYDDRFWLNGNYSVYPEPSQKACMEVARTPEGYFVGIYGCLDRTWSPEGGYTDLFVYPPRAEPPPRLSALLPLRRGEVVGVPPAQAAVTESGLPVEIEPLGRLAAWAEGRVGSSVYLLIAPVHR